MKKSKPMKLIEAMITISNHLSETHDLPLVFPTLLLENAVASRLVELRSGDLMTPERVATYYSVEEKTLANWRSKGTVGPPHTLVGGGIRYQRKDVVSYAIDNLRQSTSQQIPNRARPR